MGNDPYYIFIQVTKHACEAVLRQDLPTKTTLYQGIHSPRQTNSVRPATLPCFVIRIIISIINLKLSFMQHRSLKPAWTAVLTITIVCLQAFTAKAGGESFEIYLNNKLI